MKRRKFIERSSLGILALNPLKETISNHFLDLSMKKSRKALKLKKGQTLGLIAPSSPITAKKFDKSVNNLENLGFKLKLGKSVKESQGYLAGTDSQRLEDLHNMFSDPEVDGIWCIRGGYGSGRLLPKIDFDLIKKNPKVIIGYSDITALLIAINQETGLVCFHGPVAASDYEDYTVHQVQSVLMNPTKNFIIENSPINENNERSVFQPYVIRPGRATGQLTGGNLSLVMSMIGTPWEMTIKNKIIFLEDIGEAPYRVDRMLTQLLQCYDLNKAAAIVLGIFLGCERDDEDSWTLRETITDRLSHLSIPILYGFSIGHIDNMTTIPLGVEATLDTQTRTLTLLEQAVL